MKLTFRETSKGRQNKIETRRLNANASTPHLFGIAECIEIAMQRDSLLFIYNKLPAKGADETVFDGVNRVCDLQKLAMHKLYTFYSLITSLGARLTFIAFLVLGVSSCEGSIDVESSVPNKHFTVTGCEASQNFGAMQRNIAYEYREAGENRYFVHRLGSGDVIIEDVARACHYRITPLTIGEIQFVDRETVSAVWASNAYRERVGSIAASFIAACENTSKYREEVEELERIIIHAVDSSALAGRMTIVGRPCQMLLSNNSIDLMFGADGGQEVVGGVTVIDNDIIDWINE